MKVTVLKSFPFAADGIRSVQLAPGAEPEIPDALVDGLRREGFVAVPAAAGVGLDRAGRPDHLGLAVAAAGAFEPVEIPDVWRDLPWPELRALAHRIAGDSATVRSKGDAVAAIEAELARRAAPAGETAPGLHDMLLGSAVQPSEIAIPGSGPGTGATVPLGEIVAAAHQASGLSVAAWNALDDADREQWIAAEIETRQALAANATVDGGGADTQPGGAA